MRYKVEIIDFTANGIGHEFTRRNVTLSQAWAITTKQARRGFRLYGGTLNRANWGMRGGKFPGSYRSVVIKLDS